MGPIVIAQFHLTPRLFESICYACCLSLFLISHHPLSSGFWSRCFTEQLLLRLPTNPTLFEPMKNFQFSVYGSALHSVFSQHTYFPQLCASILQDLSLSVRWFLLCVLRRLLSCHFSPGPLQSSSQSNYSISRQSQHLHSGI